MQTHHIHTLIYLHSLTSKSCGPLYTIQPTLDTASNFTALSLSSSSLLGHRVCTYIAGLQHSMDNTCETYTWRGGMDESGLHRVYGAWEYRCTEVTHKEQEVRRMDKGGHEERYKASWAETFI